MRFLSFMSTPIGRVLRIIMGAALITLGLVVGGPVGTGLVVFGILPPMTGILGVCPINPLIGRPLRCDAACRTATEQ